MRVPFHSWHVGVNWSHLSSGSGMQPCSNTCTPRTRPGTPTHTHSEFGGDCGEVHAHFLPRVRAGAVRGGGGGGRGWRRVFSTAATVRKGRGGVEDASSHDVQEERTEYRSRDVEEEAGLDKVEHFDAPAARTT